MTLQEWVGDGGRWICLRVVGGWFWLFYGSWCLRGWLVLLFCRLLRVGCGFVVCFGARIVCC